MKGKGKGGMGEVGTGKGRSGNGERGRGKEGIIVFSLCEKVVNFFIEILLV